MPRENWHDCSHQPSARVELPPSAGELRRRDQRRYGETAISFYGRD
jgi:hypothetical protein